MYAVLGNNDGPDVAAWGAPDDRRRQPHGTIGLLSIEGGRLVGARVVPVT